MSKTQSKNSSDSNNLNMLSKESLSDFLASLKAWTQKIRAGELSARMDISNHAEIAELSQDINFVGEMLGSLSRDAELQLQRHTEHIAQKNKSFELCLLSFYTP